MVVVVCKEREIIKKSRKLIFNKMQCKIDNLI